jgi:hypothetical protein
MPSESYYTRPTFLESSTNYQAPITRRSIVGVNQNSSPVRRSISTRRVEASRPQYLNLDSPVRRSISTRRLNIEEARPIYVNRESPVRIGRSISMISSRYIPTETIKSSVVRNSGAWGKNAWGKDLKYNQPTA